MDSTMFVTLVVKHQIIYANNYAKPPQKLIYVDIGLSLLVPPERIGSLPSPMTNPDRAASKGRHAPAGSAQVYGLCRRRAAAAKQQ